MTYLLSVKEVEYRKVFFKLIDQKENNKERENSNRIKKKRMIEYNFSFYCSGSLNNQYFFYRSNQ